MNCLTNNNKTQNLLLFCLQRTLRISKFPTKKNKLNKLPPEATICPSILRNGPIRLAEFQQILQHISRPRRMHLPLLGDYFSTLSTPSTTETLTLSLRKNMCSGQRMIDVFFSRNSLPVNLVPASTNRSHLDTATICRLALIADVLPVLTQPSKS